ncbi:MAG TPA: sugar ABC transporter permease [Candidatus Acidoferrum sp.]|nr:sugar ABC transporter permease [Candidatus Acidoferrum sp.]
MAGAGASAISGRAAVMARNATMNGAGVARRRVRARTWSAWSDRHFKWLLVAPAVILILALTVYPLVYSVWVAFVNFDFQIPGHDFVGLQNFEHVVEDPVARWSLLTTAFLSVSSVVIEFLLGLGLAMAMTKIFTGRGVIMLILIVPLFVSPVVVGQIWSLLLQKPYGPFDYLVGQLFGPTDVSWLTGNPWKYVSLIVGDVWQWTPFMFVILLAGLTSVSPELYEAAELDGVSRWQIFWNITLPQIAPLILIAITFRLLDAVKLFDIIFIMTGGGPGTSTYTTSFYLYQTGFQHFHLGQATAGSWIFLILTAVLIMFLVRRMLRPERA